MMVMMLLYVSQEGLASGGFSFLVLWMYGSVVVEQCACKKKNNVVNARTTCVVRTAVPALVRVPFSLLSGARWCRYHIT
jgi:hypothetical protein